MNHPKLKYTYVGVDSHKLTHTAVFLNCFLEKIGEIQCANLPSAFPAFLQQAESLKADGTTLLWGLEDTTSYGRRLTMFLRERQIPVKHTASLLVARERKNQNFIGKTDIIDAECAARVLFNKLDTLPDAEPQDKYWMMRLLVVRRRFLVRKNTACKNHLHALIAPHYPNYPLFFRNLARDTSLAFLDRYPSPEHLNGVTVEELAAFLSDVSDGKVGTERAKTILELVAGNGHISVDFQEIQDQAIQSAIRQVRFHLREIEELEILLQQFLHTFDCPLTSMNGMDTVTAATFLSLIGDIHRFATPAKLARFAGIAPVPHSSGGKDKQYATPTGNRELNSLFYTLAVRVSMTIGPKKKILNPYFYDYYHKKLSEGKTKRQALKCLQRRLVNILWGMLMRNEEYTNPPMMFQPTEKIEPEE